MTLLGLARPAQETHIKVISDTLADAFMSKTQAIADDQIQAPVSYTHLDVYKRQGQRYSGAHRDAGSPHGR